MFKSNIWICSYFSPVTFFTFSTKSIKGGVHITYVGFRKGWTLANMVLSTAVLVCVTIWYHFYVPGYEILQDSLKFGVLYVIGIFTTLISLYFDKLFLCCCYCWKGEGQYIQFNPNFSDIIRESGTYEMHVYDTIRADCRMNNVKRPQKQISVDVFSSDFTFSRWSMMYNLWNKGSRHSVWDRSGLFHYAGQVLQCDVCECILGLRCPRHCAPTMNQRCRHCPGIVPHLAAASSLIAPQSGARTLNY